MKIPLNKGKITQKKKIIRKINKKPNFDRFSIISKVFSEFLEKLYYAE